MLKIFNLKFILIATLTYIQYTVLWFFWHNNMMHKVYYSISSVYSITDQNIWAMNFANALLVYGFVYFYRRSVKPETSLIKAVMWGVYYNLSVIGFFSFMIIGILKEWSIQILIHDMIWAVICGALTGLLVFYLHKRLEFSNNKS